MRDQVEHVRSVLVHADYLAANEAELQEAIGRALARAGIAATREVRLDARSRLDFLTADGIAIEVKVNGAPDEVRRQLERYAAHERVRGLVLATTRHRHALLEDSVGGKPFAAVWLGGLP